MNPIPKQQGDVLLLKIDKLPEGCFRRPLQDSRGVVLAEGEHTGHWHGANDISLAIMDAPDGKVFLENSGDVPVEIKHAEHKPITVEPGIWEIGIVREKDWFQGQTRKVYD